MTELAGIYPGTFDPVTNGHMDIICRAGRVLDRLTIAVAANDGKQPLFSLPERVGMIEAELAEIARPDVKARIDVQPFECLLMNFAVEIGARVIIRGLRAVSDFEYEFQMAGMNAHLNPEVETLFFMASDRNQFISSRFVKEIARLGGDVETFVAPRVAVRLRERFIENA